MDIEKSLESKLRIHECLRCGHQWPSRLEKPYMCPKCGNHFWYMAKNKEPESKKPESKKYDEFEGEHKLKNWRLLWGLSTGKIAECLGVGTYTWRRWENGTHAIPSFLPLALEALENRMTKKREGEEK